MAIKMTAEENSTARRVISAALKAREKKEGAVKRTRSR
jgi:hypothetical protein